MQKEATVRKIIQRLNLKKIRARVKSENPRWSEKKLDAFENAYRGFLFVCWKFPKHPAVPSAGIDEFWHAHILHTTEYTKDCKKIFGRYLHHVPT